jgi:hypothetical protein
MSKDEIGPVQNVESTASIRQIVKVGTLKIEGRGINVAERVLKFWTAQSRTTHPECMRTQAGGSPQWAVAECCTPVALPRSGAVGRRVTRAPTLATNGLRCGRALTLLAHKTEGWAKRAMHGPSAGAKSFARFAHAERLCQTILHTLRASAVAARCGPTALCKNNGKQCRGA